MWLLHLWQIHKGNSKRKKVFSTNDARATEKVWKFYLNTTHKKFLKYFIDLNAKAKLIKFIEGNLRGYLYQLGHSKIS